MVTDAHIEDLLEAGYTVENAIVRSSDLTMEDYGQLTLRMSLEGSGWGVVFGSFTIAFGSLNANKFEGCKEGAECLARVLDVVGVSSFNNMEGNVIRVAFKKRTAEMIGNAIEDKWFSAQAVWKRSEGK